MGLFGKTDIGELIARKRYPQAIDAIREQLAVEDSPKLRMQLADVLVMAGRTTEAVPVLIRLADEHAAQGMMARAMALLKKVQRIDPGRPGVESRIATFAQVGNTSSASRSGEVYEMHTRDAVEGGASTADAKFGLPIVFEGDTSTIPLADEETAAHQYLRNELLDTIQDVLNTPSPTSSQPARRGRAPIFSSLSEQELLAVFRGLRLLTFDAGDLILMQGDEGDRMFVITSGRCKVFMKEPGGRRNQFVGTLEEGDFFGEISLLRGEPRPNTVNAASAVELLELERSTLEQLCLTHPRVREVLEDSSQQQLAAQQDALKKRQRHGSSAPAAPPEE